MQNLFLGVCVKHKVLSFSWNFYNGRPQADGSFVPAGDSFRFKVTLAPLCHLLTPHKAVITKLCAAHSDTPNVNNCRFYIRHSCADIAAPCFYLSLYGLPRSPRRCKAAVNEWICNFKAVSQSSPLLVSTVIEAWWDREEHSGVGFTTAGFSAFVWLAEKSSIVWTLLYYSCCLDFLNP